MRSILFAFCTTLFFQATALAAAPVNGTRNCVRNQHQDARIWQVCFLENEKRQFEGLELALVHGEKIHLKVLSSDVKTFGDLEEGYRLSTYRVSLGERDSSYNLSIKQSWETTDTVTTISGTMMNQMNIFIVLSDAQD